MYRDILVHVDASEAGAGRLALALALASRFGARLSGLHVVPRPDLRPLYKPSVAEQVAHEVTKAAGEAARKAEALFRERTGGAEVETGYRTEEGDIAERLCRASALADLVVIGQSDTENPPDTALFSLAEKVLLECSAPVLVVPAKFWAREIADTVLVAWDGSAEASRAARDALPFLGDAQRVEIVAVEPDSEHASGEPADPAAMAAHLARHGVATGAATLAPGDREVSAVLLARAHEIGADLMVLGAWGHARLRELLLGGTTRGVLETADIPVLLSR